jgi:hypothetical protein
MSIQAYDPDMVEAPGAESLASGALANLWASFGQVWPLWSVLTLVGAVSAAAATDGAAAGGSLAAALGRLTVDAPANFVAALVSGVAVRLMLGRGRAAWKPDGGLFAYAVIVGLAATAVSAVSAIMGPIPTPGAAPGALMANTGVAAAALAAGFALIWAAARLTLWPVGLLFGASDLGPALAWRRMRGVVLGYGMATLLLAAPIVILGLLVVMLTQTQGPLVSHLAIAPLGGLLALVAGAVAVEVYRARVVVAQD